VSIFPTLLPKAPVHWAFFSRLRCHAKLARRGLSRSHADLAKTPSSLDARCWGGHRLHTRPLTISIAALGAVVHGKMVRRSGARLGDRVVVTGTIGDATLGLLLRRDPIVADRWGLDRAQQNYLKSRYLVPQPRNAIIEALGKYATAAMDVSDGLAGDLAKLCRASGVTANILVERVPLSDAARAASNREPALMETILTGGDDYEVLATHAVDAFCRAAQAANTKISEIGTIAAGEGTASFIDERGKKLRLARPSFSHF